MTGVFDSHAHYDDEKFAPDREELLSSLPGKGITHIMNAASDLAAAAAGIALSERFPFVWCAAGVHPHEAENAPGDLEERLTALARHEKVRAIGEIGLDYHYDFSPREKQREVFRRQIVLAKELGLPVIIHDREAHGDTLELLRELRPKGVVHCYSGSAEMAAELLRLGLYLGFTGALTFKNARRAKEAVAVIPADRLLVETDCPYMAPEPYRGRRCDSSMIPETIAVMAGIKGIGAQEMLDATRENAMRAYGIG